MHETLLDEVKFHIDHLDRYDRTIFIAGWVFSSGRAIDAIRIDTSEDYSEEIAHFDLRLDVNKFYQLPTETHTGFKCILTPDKDSDYITFSVKFQGESSFKVFKELKRKDNQSIDPQPIPKHDPKPAISVNQNSSGFIVVENFYSDPDKVREYALTLDFQANVKYHKGARTSVKTFFDGTKEFFESVLKRKITVWEEHMHNGVFQYCTAQEPLVYHTDNQTYAAIVFLTPDAPPECGTSFYKSKHNGLLAYPTAADCARFGKTADELHEEMFAGNFYDKTRWELVDVVGNVYNRLVIFDAKKVHAASAYFGDNMHNSRLFHMFFFDAE